MAVLWFSNTRAHERARAPWGRARGVVLVASWHDRCGTARARLTLRTDRHPALVSQSHIDP